ncbi:unnamed protein product [Penicillium salamii]|nr:unnamed protein product [Penicillium salamii]
MSPFVYPALPEEPNITRMVRLLPHADRRAPIECELSNYDLSMGDSRSHTYEALSYCWEGNVRSESIALNGCEFGVTRNLFAALQHIRDPQLSRTLWIDAICINQGGGESDIEEKNKQIPLMRKIYAQAGRVIVWLGDDREDGEKALRWINHLAWQQDQSAETSTEDGRSVISHSDVEDGEIQTFGMEDPAEDDPPTRYYVERYYGKGNHSKRDSMIEHVLSLTGERRRRLEPIELTAQGEREEEERKPREEGLSTQTANEGCDELPSQQHDVACLNLLQRDWLRRVWILQEVGVARHIDVMCGSIQISAHAFTKGLSRLKLPQPFLSRLGPVTHLIKGAPYRPRFDVASPGILSLGELLSMYRNYHATLQHDKIYALLGLSADASADVLKPNYNAPWHTVLREVTSHIFPGCSVQTWEGRASAVVKTRGWIMGHVGHVTSSMRDFGQQNITCHFHKPAFSLWKLWPSDWMLPACAELVQEGDLICHLQGRSHPSILRLCNDHFRLLSPYLWLRSKDHIQTLSHKFDQGQLDHGHDITLTWNIPMDKLSATPKELKLEQITPEVENSLNEIELRLEIIAQVMLNVATRVLDSKTSQVKAWENILKQRGTDVSVSEIYKLAIRVIKPDRDLDEKFGGFLPYGDFVADEKSKGILYRDFIHLLLKYSGESAPDVEMLRWACQDYGHYGVLDLLFKYRAENLAITEDVLKAVARNVTGFNVKALSEHRRERLPVSEEVLKVAVENRANFPISEEVVKAAAGRGGLYRGHKTLEVLLQHAGEELPISEEVVKAVAGDPGDFARKSLEAILQHAGENLPISEEVLKVAVENRGYHAPGILEILLQRAGENFPISEEVIKAAAGNPAGRADKALEVLLQHAGEKLPISEEVVKAAAGNPGNYPGEALTVLFEYAGENLSISEEVVKAAAGNPGYYADKALEVLFQHAGENLLISEEVVKAAAGNPGNYVDKVLKVLFQHAGENIPISEEVVKAAAGNPGSYGHQALEVLFRHRENLAISEEVMKASARNDGDKSMQIMQILKMHRQDSAVISQAVLEAASENPRYASKMSSFLNSWLSEQSNAGDNSPEKCD